MTRRRGWRQPPACTEVVDVPRMEIDRPAWLEARRSGIGGSDASVILDLNPYRTRLALWLDKTGRADPEPDNDAMEAGRRLEPVMRQWFTDRTGIRTAVPPMLRSREHPHVLVNLDAFTSDGGIYEAKTLSWRQREDWDDDQVADHAEIQAQHGMLATGLDHAWVVGLIDGRDFRIRRVERDPEFVNLLLDEETAFWRDYVLADVEPPISARDLPVVKQRYPRSMPDEVVEVDEAWWAPRKQLLDEVKEQIKDLSAIRDGIEAEIRARAGSAEAIKVDDTVVATLRSYWRRGYEVSPAEVRKLNANPKTPKRKA